MNHPPLATHMVSLPDGKLGNNALGYCTSTSRNPGVITSLTPLGSGWSRWILQGTPVVVKWLKLPGQPEFLHILDGETSTSTRLPRRLRQRSLDDLVTIRTSRPAHFSVELVCDYGRASASAVDTIAVTPLGKWQRDVWMGAEVELRNLSAPGNPIKNGMFGSQSTIVRGGRASARFLKDSGGG